MSQKAWHIFVEVSAVLFILVVVLCDDQCECPCHGGQHSRTMSDAFSFEVHPSTLCPGDRACRHHQLSRGWHECKLTAHIGYEVRKIQARQSRPNTFKR